jgi:hypothetical protein
MIPFGDGRPNPPRKGFFHAIENEKEMSALRVTIHKETWGRKIFMLELWKEFHPEDRDHHVIGKTRRKET